MNFSCEYIDLSVFNIYIRSVNITIENQTKQENEHKSGKYEL